MHAIERKSVVRWADICAQYPNEWVLLLESDRDAEGALRSARVGDHDRSLKQLLNRIGASYPESTLLHTWGRPLRTPRIEMTSEIRNITRARR